MSIDGPWFGGGIELKRFGLFADPYETHHEPLDKVDLHRNIAEEGNLWAHFCAFGTCKLEQHINGGYLSGRLNYLLSDRVATKNSSPGA